VALNRSLNKSPKKGVHNFFPQYEESKKQSNKIKVETPSDSAKKNKFSSPTTKSVSLNNIQAPPNNGSSNNLPLNQVSMGNIQGPPNPAMNQNMLNQMALMNQTGQNPLMSQFQSLIQQNPNLLMDYMKQMGFQQPAGMQQFPLTQVNSELQVLPCP
jgi:hypothetical protein